MLRQGERVDEKLRDAPDSVSLRRRAGANVRRRPHGCILPKLCPAADKRDPRTGQDRNMSSVRVRRRGHHGTCRDGRWGSRRVCAERDARPRRPRGDGARARRRAAARPPRTRGTSWERRGVNQFRMLHSSRRGFAACSTRELPDVAQRSRPPGPCASTRCARARRDHRRLPRDRPTCTTRDSRAARWPRPRSPAWSKPTRRHVRRGVAVDGLLTGDGSTAFRTSSVCAPTRATSCSPISSSTPAVGARRSRACSPTSARAPPDRGAAKTAASSTTAAISAPATVRCPPMFGPLLMPYESLSILTLPADNGTWGVGLVASAKDAALRGLKDVDTWTRTVKGFPLVAHWLDGEPLDDGVAVMAKIEDRHRTFVIDGTGRHRCARARRLVGVHEPVGRARRSHRRDARGRVARPVARSRRPIPSSSRSAGTPRPMETVEPWYRGNARLRPGIASPRSTPRSEGRTSSSRPEYEMTMALQAAAEQGPRDAPDLPRDRGRHRDARRSVRAAGPVRRVVELGGGWRDEPASGPEPRGAASRSSRRKGDIMKVDSSGVAPRRAGRGRGPAGRAGARLPRHEAAVVEAGSRARRRRLPGDHATTSAATARATSPPRSRRTRSRSSRSTSPRSSTISASSARTSSATTGVRRSCGRPRPWRRSGSTISLRCRSATRARSRTWAWPQREKSWYMLLFQFARHRRAMADDRRRGELPRVVAPPRLRRRLSPSSSANGSLTPGLNYYRANITPEALVGPRSSCRRSRRRRWASGARTTSRCSRSR